MSKTNRYTKKCLPFLWLCLPCLFVSACGGNDSPVFCLKIYDMPTRADELKALAMKLAEDEGLASLDESNSRKAGHGGYALSIRAENDVAAISFFGGEATHCFACVYGDGQAKKTSDVATALSRKVQQEKFQVELDLRRGFESLPDYAKKIVREAASASKPVTSGEK